MNRKGLVLIILLVITAALVGAVLSIEMWASKNFDQSQHIYVDNQVAFYFHSAIKVAKQLLKDDKNSYDSPDENWYNLPPFNANANTIISLKIFPLNSKININNIFSSNKNLKERTIKALETIAQDNGWDEKNIISNLNQWKNYKQNEPNEFYLNEGYHPYGNFYSLKEIEFVKGLRGFSKLFHKFFCASNSIQRININFASKSVIEAYLPELASCSDEITKQRKKKPFKNITELLNLSCIDQNNYIKIQPYITTKSDLFGVSISVKIEDTDKEAFAVLKRTYGHVKVVKYFEGNGYYE